MYDFYIVFLFLSCKNLSMTFHVGSIYYSAIRTFYLFGFISDAAIQSHFTGKNKKNKLKTEQFIEKNSRIFGDYSKKPYLCPAF